MMTGPAGWLAAFQAGDLLVLTRSGDTLTVVSGSIENDGHDEARALWESFDARREELEDAAEVPLLLLDILVSDPARVMFTQVISPTGPTRCAASARRVRGVWRLAVDSSSTLGSGRGRQRCRLVVA